MSKSTSSQSMTKEELERTMRTLEPLYDMVRLVDPSATQGCTLSDSGQLGPTHRCFDLLNKGHRCHNCISARTVAHQKSISKFELVGQNAFFITTRYVEIDGERRSLELVKQVTNDTLVAPPQSDAGQAVRDLIELDAQRRYLHPVTGTLDQRYLEDGIGVLRGSKLAIVRIRGLEPAAHNHSEQNARLQMLRTAARALKSIVRNADTLVYLEDGSFAIIFDGISKSHVMAQLELIRHSVLDALACLDGMDHPDVRIGAIMRHKSINELVALAREALCEAHDGNPIVLHDANEEGQASTAPVESASAAFGHEVHVDALTGLPTAHVFRDKLNYLIDQQSPTGTALRVVYVDVENFKSFNRTYGMAQGDMLLVRMAHVLNSEFPQDLKTRAGVDTFYVATYDANVHERLANLREVLNELKGEVALQLKAGVCEVVDANTDARSCMDRAKIACDSIKGIFDKRVRVFDSDLERQIIQHDHIVKTLDEAIEEEYIQPYYQAIVRSFTGNVCSMEALSRWVDPTVGAISPADVIPTLEQRHLIHKHDLHILRCVCRDLRTCLDSGLPVVPVSVNLSRLDFEMCDVFHEVEGILAQYGIGRSLVDIEVTESALDKSASFFRPQIERFRTAGYGVWMDDFGSGYSSLNLLKDYQFDVLKIDMAFLRGLEHNASARKIVSSVVSMAKRLGIHTLAEGVENADQLAFLKSIGCEMVQGFLFSRPAPNGLVELGATYGTSIEKPEDRSYFESIGRVNLLSQEPAEAFGGSDDHGDYGMPLAILDWDGKRLHFFSANVAFLDYQRREGNHSMAMVESALNKEQELIDTFRGLDGSSAERVLSYRIGNRSHVSAVQLIARRNQSAAFLVYPLRRDNC